MQIHSPINLVKNKLSFIKNSSIHTFLWFVFFTREAVLGTYTHTQTLFTQNISSLYHYVVNKADQWSYIVINVSTHADSLLHVYKSYTHHTDINLNLVFCNK